MKLFKNTRTKGFFFAFMAGLSWGSSSPVAQYLFQYKGIVSSWLVPYRLITAGILLLVYAKMKNMDVKSCFNDKKEVLRLMAFGILGMMGMQFSFFCAVEHTNAGVATIFQYLNPAILILYFAVIHKIMPKKTELIAVACSLIGIFLVATHGNLGELAISPKGVFWGMLLALATCCYGVLPVPLLKKYPAEVISGWGMLFGGVVLACITKPWYLPETMDMTVVFGFLAIVFFCTILPFCFYLTSLKYISSVYAGLLSAVEPVAATVVAAIFLGTKFQMIDVFGFALVLSTMFILNIGNVKVK